MFSFDIFSNAIDIIVMAKASPNTDRKLMLPTSLKANPIAKTAIAISSIVPTPFLILLSCFGSDPTSETLSYFPPDFCLEIAIIVS